jgi:SAM-dependent methyltransferase
MTVKEHYDNHLGNFYSWYIGDFTKNKEDFKTFCIENKITTDISNQAIDLGAGNGIQSLALAELGFQVTAVDFNQQLLNELAFNTKEMKVTIVNDDISNLVQFSSLKPGLIVCCGDTLPHLNSIVEIENLLNNSLNILVSGGKLVLTFRDYSQELQDTQRFIPVKSDDKRVFTCFLEYFRDNIRVTDLLYEFDNNQWVQKVSSYYKLRLTQQFIVNHLIYCGFSIILNKIENRIIQIIAQKI